MEIISIIALNLLLYYRTIRFYLVADDLAWFLKQPTLWKFKHINSLRSLTIWIKQRLYGGFTFGQNVKLEHCITTLLHTVISVLIYIAFGSDQVSLCAAILYACNPLNNQTSVWLNGRRYQMNIILVLGMIMCLGVKYGWLYAGALYCLTPMFHITAVFAPILLLWKYPWILLAVIAVVAFKFEDFVYAIKERYKKIPDADHREFTPQRLIIVTKVYGHYFFKMFFPGICAMTYPTLYHWGISKEGNKDAYSFNWMFYRGCLALGISGSIISYFLSNSDYKMACYAVFMALSLLQWCQIIAVFQDLADRYAGMATVFAMFFLSYFVHMFVPFHAVAVLACFAGYYIPNLLTVMRMYRSEGARWEYQRHYFPHLPAPLKFENEYLIQDKGDYLRAIVLIQEYLRYGGRDFSILFQAAKCNQAVGHYKEAIKFAEEASKNYTIGQEEKQSERIKTFLEHCKPPSGTIVGEPSRQVKRANERKEAKKK